MTEQTGPRLIRSLEEVQAYVGDLSTLSLHSSFDNVKGDERVEKLQEFCVDLIRAAKAEKDHFKQMDSQFSSLLSGALRQARSPPFSEPASGSNVVLSEAASLLSRFPAVPQGLVSLSLYSKRTSGTNGNLWGSIRDGTWASKYVVEDARSKITSPVSDPERVFLQLKDLNDLTWANMFVTSFIDTNNLILILKISTVGHTPDLNLAHQLTNYVNLLSEIIFIFEELMTLANLGIPEGFDDVLLKSNTVKDILFDRLDDMLEQELQVVKAFLSSVWQRSVMLLFYYVVGVQLWQGPSSAWSSLLSVHGISHLIELRVDLYRGEGVPYLCNWAFELLRTSRTSLALDYRRMISRFDDHFKGLKGRCIIGSEESCVGEHPETCQRFTASETKSQSVHAGECVGKCLKLSWDEDSYRRCMNPCAVRIEENATKLCYCRASDRTMAISHVWSHGHGGRPEEGINVCLHKFYCRLARSFHCDSYWIDSTCIPEDQELRKEAIKAINGIFSGSKVTLVLDKDLQSVSIEDSSITAYETLFSVLLVCDWGVRAWTMLEAIRGSRSIHVLCKQERSISLKDLFQNIHQHGAVDLAVLLGSVQHLLPSLDSKSTKTVEEVGHLLSQRHASRVGDELIIWTLLSSEKGISKTPLDFWQGREGINTAFLVSNAPRIHGHPGYGWCPATPYIRPQERFVNLGNNLKQYYTVRYPSYDGRGSFLSQLIPSQGLQGKWLVRNIDSEEICRFYDDYEDEKTSMLWLDQDRESILHTRDFNPDIELFPRPDVARAYARIRELTTTLGHRVCLLRPLAEDGLSPYKGGTDRGEDFTLLVAICHQDPRQMTDSQGNSSSSSCNFSDMDEFQKKNGWQWDGVHEWEEIYSPAWKVEEILLI